MSYTVVINSTSIVFIGGRLVADRKVEGRNIIEILTTACAFLDHSSLCISDCSTLCTISGEFGIEENDGQNLDVIGHRTSIEN